MNWFERHLNWMAVIITFGGFLFTCLMFLLTQGFNLVHPFFLLAFEFKLYLEITVFLTTLVYVVCMTCVIKKKQRNLALLSFFIPSGLLSLFFYCVLNPTLLYRTSFYWDDYFEFYAIVFMCFLFSAGLWIIGLIILLVLKAKQGKRSFPHQASELETTDSADSTEFSVSPGQIRNRGFFWTIIVLTIITLVVGGFSCVRMNHGYQTFTYETYTDPEETDLHYSEFAFECPRSYYRSWGGSDIIWYRGDELVLSHRQVKLFRFESTSLQINVSPTVIREGNPVYPSLIEQCLYYYFKSAYGWHELDIQISDLTITQTVVDGISAEYATFLTFHPDHPFSHLWYEVKMVCFERKGIFWTIILEKINDKIIDSDPHFEHLLGTFNIIE